MDPLEALHLAVATTLRGRHTHDHGLSMMLAKEIHAIYVQHMTMSHKEPAQPGPAGPTLDVGEAHPAEGHDHDL